MKYAPLVRVSTETQERRGESLQTQKDEIERSVKFLGGSLIFDPWRYSGQEHATGIEERHKLNALLNDAGKGLFDAIMVCDASRWSRDNAKSKEGLEILRKNGIRFFAGTTEYDLFKPADTLFLGMATEMNEFFAAEQAKKSILNRIARAKRGIPVAGKLPFGRTFDKESGKWGIDREKQKQIETAAEMYLNGEQIPKIAKMFSVNAASMWKTLTRRAGDTWEIRFRKKSLAIDETVLLKIPPLLPQETVNKILQRKEGNKTYTHGEIKHTYLLSRTVFCDICGYAMYGQTNHGNRRYYRHFRDGAKPCSDPRLWVPAEKLEEAVFIRMFGLLGGDVDGIEKSIKQAIPDLDEIKNLRSQIETLKVALKKIEQEEGNICRAIAKGVVSDDMAGATVNEIQNRKKVTVEELNRIGPLIVNVPTENQIKVRAALIRKTVGEAFSSAQHFRRMTDSQKKELIKHLFAGKDTAGRRYGVYVNRGSEEGTFDYRIVGGFEPLMGHLKPGKIEVADVLDTGLSVEFLEDIIGDGKELNIAGQCDACHGFGFH